MRYLMLLYGGESGAGKVDMEGNLAAARFAAGRGARVTGNLLVSVTSATTVRQREGRLLLSDGPLDEAEPPLSGYCLVECEDLDQAIAIAELFPAAAAGGVEIRPLHPGHGWGEIPNVGRAS